MGMVGGLGLKVVKHTWVLSEAFNTCYEWYASKPHFNILGILDYCHDYNAMLCTYINK